MCSEASLAALPIEAQGGKQLECLTEKHNDAYAWNTGRLENKPGVRPLTERHVEVSTASHCPVIRRNDVLVSG